MKIFANFVQFSCGLYFQSCWSILNDMHCKQRLKFCFRKTRINRLYHELYVQCKFTTDSLKHLPCFTNWPPFCIPDLNKFGLSRWSRICHPCLNLPSSPWPSRDYCGNLFGQKESFFDQRRDGFL